MDCHLFLSGLDTSIPSTGSTSRITPVAVRFIYLLAAHIKFDIVNVVFMCAGAQFYGRGVVQVLTQVYSQFLRTCTKA